jgi:hypothetical protein
MWVGMVTDASKPAREASRGRIEQVIAFVSDLEVARAAYNAAVLSPASITSRQRARILDRSFT